eukprot:gnl/MRDRNA2_/MRDRNA2_34338_c0_seq1.p1 gnl/MRDRNA2_/MRDRNA2_34338_c0~~gnl/MRDRNA2_/MRDRNA2_34338_c0_seq1.p1  ORF type:complete len:379 (+),score=89.26 gnl/MRDRNA2_/MRDRNA2_34338_c0_seq1:152-1288(+)
MATLILPVEVSAKDVGMIKVEPEFGENGAIKPLLRLALNVTIPIATLVDLLVKVQEVQSQSHRQQQEPPAEQHESKATPCDPAVPPPSPQQYKPMAASRDSPVETPPLKSSHYESEAASFGSSVETPPPPSSWLTRDSSSSFRSAVLEEKVSSGQEASSYEANIRSEFDANERELNLPGSMDANFAASKLGKTSSTHSFTIPAVPAQATNLGSNPMGLHQQSSSQVSATPAAHSTSVAACSSTVGKNVFPEGASSASEVLCQASSSPEHGKEPDEGCNVVENRWIAVRDWSPTGEGMESMMKVRKGDVVVLEWDQPEDEGGYWAYVHLVDDPDGRDAIGYVPRKILRRSVRMKRSYRREVSQAEGSSALSWLFTDMCT